MVCGGSASVGLVNNLCHLGREALTRTCVQFKLTTTRLLDSGSMVSTFPKTFASEVYMMDDEQRLNLLGVLGEFLRHHGMRRNVNVPQMAGELQGGGCITTDSVSEERCRRWSDNFRSSKEQYVLPVTRNDRLERALSHATEHERHKKTLSNGRLFVKKSADIIACSDDYERQGHFLKRTF